MKGDIGVDGYVTEELYDEVCKERDTLQVENHKLAAQVAAVRSMVGDVTIGIDLLDFTGHDASQTWKFRQAFAKLQDQVFHHLPASAAALLARLEQSEKQSADMLELANKRTRELLKIETTNAVLLANQQMMQDALQKISDGHVPDQPAASGDDEVTWTRRWVAQLRLWAREGLKAGRTT